MDRLTQIEIFVRVVEEGSFSATARALKITQPSVSKAIADLEHKLHLRLLHRTTRSVKLTEAGEAYYRRMKEVTSLIDVANAEANADATSIRGKLRVNTSAMLVERLVMPAVIAFHRDHPQVEIEVTMDDRRIDLIERATDVVVRVGTLANSTLRVRRAGVAPLGLFASARYLAEVGFVADAAQDISTLHLIRYVGQKPGNATLDRMATAMIVGNAVLMHQALLGGAGVALLPRFLVADQLASGEVIEFSHHVSGPPMEVSLLHAFQHDTPAAVVAFIESAVRLWRQEQVLFTS